MESPTTDSTPPAQELNGGVLFRLRATMFRALLRKVMDVMLRDARYSRRGRRFFWSHFYDQSSREFLPAELMSFLNYGYLANPSELDGGDSAEVSDRLSRLLYKRLVAGVELEGKTAVEVGCGPGAGSAYLARECRPASLTGIDLSDGMIDWCHAHHKATNLSFLQGDAMDLPLSSESVDVVLNLESSHCYPSREKFFSEVVRVLRPGGTFLFADALPVGSVEGPDTVTGLLEEAGLIVDSRTDITENVLAAREAVSHSEAFREHVRQCVPSHQVPGFEEVLAMIGSQAYEQLAAGKMPYVHWRLSKPAG